MVTDSPAVLNNGGVNTIDVSCPGGQAAVTGVWTVKPTFMIDGVRYIANTILVQYSAALGNGWRYVINNQAVDIPANSGDVTLTVVCA